MAFDNEFDKNQNQDNLPEMNIPEIKLPEVEFPDFPMSDFTSNTVDTPAAPAQAFTESEPAPVVDKEMISEAVSASETGNSEHTVDPANEAASEIGVLGNETAENDAVALAEILDEKNSAVKSEPEISEIADFDSVDKMSADDAFKEPEPEPEIPAQTAEAIPEQTPEIIPEQTPEPTPESVPEVTPESAPEQTPEPTPEATSEQTPAKQEKPKKEKAPKKPKEPKERKGIKGILTAKKAMGVTLRILILLAIPYAYLMLCGLIFDKWLRAYSAVTFIFYSLCALYLAAFVLIILSVIWSVKYMKQAKRNANKNPYKNGTIKKDKKNKKDK